MTPYFTSTPTAPFASLSTARACTVRSVVRREMRVRLELEVRAGRRHLEPDQRRGRRHLQHARGTPQRRAASASGSDHSFFQRTTRRS